MTRDNLRARLEDADIELSIDSKLQQYEELVEKSNISEIEKFETKDGTQTIVFEVRRRIEMLRELAEEVGMMKIAKRAQRLLDTFR